MTHTARFVYHIK